MVITEARKAYMKKYHQDNKEKIAKQQKEYKQDNKEYIKEYHKEYIKEYNKTPKGKKSKTIKNWKRIGLVHDNYEELYDRYLDTEECSVCKYIFDKTNWRCMDHDHNTGLFRQILCNKCNVHDNWKKLL
jgi:hypothetical protein